MGGRSRRSHPGCVGFVRFRVGGLGFRGLGFRGLGFRVRRSRLKAVKPNHASSDLGFRFRGPCHGFVHRRAPSVM